MLKRLLIFICLAGSLALASAQTILEVSITQSNDDAEEFVGETSEGPAGTVYLDSSDLELSEDAGTTQVIGLRFAGVELPPGATITRAYIQFTVDETSEGETSLALWGEASDDAATFTVDLNALSSRPRTAATVSWSPTPWTSEGEAGPSQQTPDLAPLLQEVINRPGWQSGNAFAVFLEGRGDRTAESFDGRESRAPVLYIDYTEATTQEPEPATPEVTEESSQETPAEITPAPSVQGTLARVNDARYALTAAGNSQVRGNALLSGYNDGTTVISVFVSGQPASASYTGTLSTGDCGGASDETVFDLSPTEGRRGGLSTTVIGEAFPSLQQMNLKLELFDTAGTSVACGEVGAD